MKRTEDVYRPALDGKKIPILTLDNTWHRLFTQTEKNAKIDHYAALLNELLKRQGKINNLIKDIRRVKKQLMNGLMTEGFEQTKDKKKEKKLEESRNLIEECNEKLETYMEEAKELPGKIQEVNQQLMLATMEVCYRKLKENAAEITEMEAWMKAMRIELKKKTIRKQEKEEINQALYNYMREIFGAEVVEIFDIKYHHDKKYLKLANEQKTDEGKEAED